MAAVNTGTQARLRWVSGHGCGSGSWTQGTKAAELEGTKGRGECKVEFLAKPP